MVSKPLVVVVGPTAVGKTRTAIAIARAIGGEVVSADSRQVYIGMDIGTAKPSTKERASVPHHLIDYLPPDSNLTLAAFQDSALAAIEDVLARDKVPLLVGGSGQYVRAVVEGWGVPRVPPDAALRQNLLSFAAVYSSTVLHARLAQLDPLAARRIDYRNVRRVVRALEVCLLEGRPISEVQRKHAPPYDVLWLGLTRPRPTLYDRVDTRIDHMLENGLIEEVRRLMQLGYSLRLPAMSALGYREIGQHLSGEISLEEAAIHMKRETRRFVRQQSNWFSINDPRINWFDLELVEPSSIVAFVQEWLARG